jgi:glucosamine kinase
MTLAMGVDGGGTQTRCLVIDECARVVGIGVGGASKPDAVDPAIGRVNLQQAILTACEPRGGPASIDTVFLGMGGVVSEADVEVVHRMLDGLALRPGIPIGVDHDVRIALAGGTAGKAGIALIVGTGSSCYGRNAAGESWRSGGWGFIIDDFGSGFYLGQQALTAVIKAFDGRGPETALTAPIMEALDIHDMNELVHRIYYPRLNHSGIAALAPVVAAIALRDPVARLIIDRGCAELALMVAATTRKLHLPADVTVIPVGSLATESELVRRELERAIVKVLPKAQIRTPVAPPVAGAALLALQQAGITLENEVFAGLQNVV